MPFPNLRNRFTKERISVGLDIGTQTVKLVKLRFSQDVVELAGFELEPVQLEMRQLLNKFKQAEGFDTVNIGVSGPSTVIRYVNFLKMSKEELQKALKFEAQKHIPFSVEEVDLDASILKEDLPDNKMLILLAAVKKELVSSRLKIMESEGLKVSLVDIDSLALVNAFNFSLDSQGAKEPKAAALLNIGASLSNLDIMERGFPRLSRDIHIAGNNFTQKIADIFSIDFKAAEECKLNPDQEKANKISAAVESVLANLAVEIRTSFDYYESQNASNVAKIFLSGGSSRFAGIKDMLTNLLGIEVEHWDPLQKLSVASGLDADKLKAVSPQFAVALGLALR